jgi:hypothetical protein
MESELRAALARMGQKRAPLTPRDIELDAFDEFVRTPDPEDFRDFERLAAEIRQMDNEEA